MERKYNPSLEEIAIKPNEFLNEFKKMANQTEIELNRFRQDCRKRALELAHQQVMAPKWQKFIQDENILIKDKEDQQEIVSEAILIGLADKYYAWLTKE